MKYSVTTVTPRGYAHTGAFAEVSQTVAAGLRALGHDAVETTDLGLPDRRHIVLGANLLPHVREVPPPGSILYQLEQAGSEWMTPALLDLFRRFETWDYSATNVAWLAGQGVTARVVPIGWAPELARIPAGEGAIDVLFYGSMNERRRAILDDLSRRGVVVRSVFGLYGTARDRLVAQSKIVLNLHYYEAQVFEVVRVSYLLGNGRCVASERGANPGEEAPFAEAVAFAEYGELADRCVKLLRDHAARARLASAGRLVMGQRREAEFLARALEA